MSHKRSLRRRITFFFVLFGTLLSGVIGLGVHMAIEDIESKLLHDTLGLELEYFRNQPERTLGTYKQLSADSILYYVDEEQKQIVPDKIRDLPDGDHEIFYDQRVTYHVLITTLDEGKVYLIKNATPFERREITLHLALIGSVVAAALIALWLGIWLSGKVIAPLKELTDEMAKLKPGDQPAPRIASQDGDDEVGQLAAMFDSYQQKMAQFIRREQDFTADASHELRTPLAVINGAAEVLLENNELPQKARRQLERISRAGERMSQMLEILLLLARDTTGTQMSGNAESCRVEDVTAEIQDQCRLNLHEGVELRSEILTGFSLDAPRVALAIVLCNLLRNAVNHTERGAITIKVNQREIEVSDSGSGIAAEDLPHIFERNFRGRNTKQPGSGIGLSIVKRICDRYGWQIEIDSVEGEGTTVRLRF